MVSYNKFLDIPLLEIVEQTSKHNDAIDQYQNENHYNS